MNSATARCKNSQNPRMTFLRYFCHVIRKLFKFFSSSEYSVVIPGRLATGAAALA